MKTTALFTLALSAVLGSGCNSIVGIHDPIESAPVKPQSDGGARDEVTAFLGTWQNTTGKISLTCNNNPTQTLNETSTLTVMQGTSSDLVIRSGDCALTASVTGDTATLVGHQRCDVITMSEMDTYDIATGSFVLTGPGVGKVTLAGTVKVVTPTNAGTCDFVQNDPCTKVP